MGRASLGKGGVRAHLDDEPAAAINESIRDDERAHNKMFREMYRALTGQEIADTSDEQYKKVRSYSEGLQQALMGELGAVEKYRNIWFGLFPGMLPRRDFFTSSI